MWEIKKSLCTDPILKLDIVKNVAVNIKRELNIVISYKNPKELLNQRSEIPNVCRYRKVGYLVDK